MPTKIHILDEKTINQIAAGEVVENPSSCVKELVENALDAGATHIEIEVIAGGRKKIEIIDNGSGMGFDDTLLAIERHATSKIKTIQDMDTIASMGFRGEALASIGAISKLTLHTSDGKESSELVCQGGRVIDHKVVPRPQGTTVIIESLFYNVPARKEFQKSIAQDHRDIMKVISNLALAYPCITFRYTQDHQEVFNLFPNKHLSELENLKLRIQRLFGEQLHEELVEIEQEKEGIFLKGFIAKASSSRPNRLGQHLFVNRRSIDSKLVSMAVREGYSTRLSEGKFPIFFLSMQLDPKQIDVNVHPQKKEIRFKESFEIKRIISSLINQALSKGSQTLAPPLQVIRKELFFEYAATAPSTFQKKQVEDIELFQQEKPTFFPEATFDFIPNIIGIYDSYIFVETKSLLSQMSVKSDEAEGLMLIHQKRAQERILFDTLLHKSSKIAIQNLLLAETLQCSDIDASIIEEYLPLFNQLGLSLRLIGRNSFMLDGLPSMIPASSAKNLIESVLEEVRLGASKKPLEEQKKQLIAQAISKSIAWKNIEHVDEACTLLIKLFKCEHFEYSPKGKPIIVPLSLNELKKMFKS